MDKQAKLKNKINPLSVLWQVIKFSLKKFWLVFFIAVAIFIVWYFRSSVEKSSVNIVTIVTTIMAVLILLFDAYKSWESSLEKKLTVFFTESAKSTENQSQDTFRMTYIRASLAHEGDTRSLAIQLGSQLLQRIMKDELEACNKTLKDCEISILRPPQLAFDAGGIDIFRQKSVVNNSVVIDSIVVINLEDIHKTIVSFLKYDPKKKGKQAPPPIKDEEQLALKESIASSILMKLEDHYLFSQAPILSSSKIEPLPNTENTNNKTIAIPQELLSYIKPYIPSTQIEKTS